MQLAKVRLGFLLVVLIVLAVDWGLGAAATRGILPYWTFLLANIPFGALCWRMESHWEGTRYVIGGQTADEVWAIVVFGAVVLAQSFLYYAVLRMRRARRSDRVTRQTA